MMTSANSSDSKLLSLYFCRLQEPPYWMLFPAMVDSKLCEDSCRVDFLSASNRPELFVLITPLKSRSHHDVAHQIPPTNVPIKSQLPISYSF